MPIPPGLAPIGIIGTPVSAMDPGNVDKSHREAVSAVWNSIRPELGWTLEFMQDDPGPALVSRSADAELVVVGTHEHVGLSRLVSGSVSRYCLSHARCPTVIVPVDDRTVPPERDDQPMTAARD